MLSLDSDSLLTQRERKIEKPTYKKGNGKQLLMHAPHSFLPPEKNTTYYPDLFANVSTGDLSFSAFPIKNINFKTLLYNMLRAIFNRKIKQSDSHQPIYNDAVFCYLAKRATAVLIGAR